MPIDPVTGSLIAAGMSLAGQGGNAYAQSKTNKKTREYNEQMWHLQNSQNQVNWLQQNAHDQKIWNQQNKYNEGLWDKQNQYNEKMWHMMNDYNSPMAQMNRYKEAGLNPHLIYGQPNTTGSISTHSQDSSKMGSSTKNTPSALGYSPKAPTFDPHQGILAYTSFQEAAARTNNLEEQNKLLVMDQTDKAVTIAGKAQTNARGAVELDMARDLYKTSVDAAKENLRKIGIENEVALKRNDREAAMNSSNLAEAVERIMKSRGERLSTEMDVMLKQADMDLKRMGIQPGDSLFFRAIGRALNYILQHKDTSPLLRELNMGEAPNNSDKY